MKKMAERRSESMMVTVEPTLRKIMDLALEKDNIAISSYFRKLLIADLRQRGLLNDTMLLKITEG